MRLFVALLLAAAPLAVAFARSPSRPRSTTPGIRMVSGKVTRIDGNRVEVKPWNASLPKRMWVTIRPETRMLLQRKAGLDAAKPGDRVTVLGTDTPIPPRPAEPADAARPKAPEPVRPPSPPRASAIYVYPDADASPEERKLFYRAARGFFIGARRGGVDRPSKDAPIVPGILVSTRPLVVRDAQGDHPFHAREVLFVVEHVPTRLEDLDRGETITARCRIADTTPEGDLVANLVVVGPDPPVGKKTARRLLRREQRPLRRESSPASPADSNDEPDDEEDGDL